MPVIFTNPPNGHGADPVLGLAASHADQLRGEEEEEALHPHPGRLGGREVAELVQDDQRREPGDGRGPSSSTRAHPTDLLPGALPCLGVDGEQVLEVARPARRQRLQRALDHLGDRRERDPAVEERLAPRPRRRRSARRAPSPPPRRPRAPAAGTGRRPDRGLEGELADGREVERRAARRRRAPGSAAHRRSARACPDTRGERGWRRR